jgi:hypothetical protein
VATLCGSLEGAEVSLDAPQRVPRFDAAEFVFRVADPPVANPFTEVEVLGTFRTDSAEPVAVRGFADAEDGSVYRLRFSPAAAGATYRWELRLQGPGLERSFAGELACDPSERPGPVVADPSRPRHFVHAGSRRPFYHLGYTAYHLLDPSNDDAQVERTIDYCAREGFNKVRFLLAGYPRDHDRRTSQDEEYGVPDPWKAPNYGARPGQVNPLPAWHGKPHAYDFTRFHVAHWQRADRAVRRMREKGIVATCIFTIEKQDLPKEYGRLSEHERRFYAYAVARLAAFDNVWWDLGNEHNEFRDTAWGEAMGAFVKEHDPYSRPLSAHAYKDFLYPAAKWADFIVTQQYGSEREVYDWVLKYRAVPKPYVNEEYGYEGSLDKPGHGQNADWTRRCHWSIAMAGGYATYGDWSGGVSYFYMGEPGPGKAAAQLKHLRAFFESLPFAELEPQGGVVEDGFALAGSGRLVIYLARGGAVEVTMAAGSNAAGSYTSSWFDPRTGRSSDGPRLSGGKNSVTAPSAEDWVLSVQSES